MSGHKAVIFKIYPGFISNVHANNFFQLFQGIETDQTDLKRDIAFNLSLIYLSSGNTTVARKMLYTYGVM